MKSCIRRIWQPWFVVKELKIVKEIIYAIWWITMKSFLFLKGIETIEPWYKKLETGQEILTVHAMQGDCKPIDQFAFFTRLSIRYFGNLHGFAWENPSSL